MAQNYTTIAPTQVIAASLTPLLERDDAAASNFSGTAFPSTNLLLGMMCYRTDQLKLYELTALPVVGVSAAVWTLIFDLSTGSAYAPFASSVAWSGVTAKPTTISGYGITDALAKTGDSATGKINFVASGTAAASISVPHGSAPSSPANGDLWSTTAAFFVRVNGATRTVSVLEAAETFSAKKTFAAASVSAASVNVPAGSAPTSPIDGDLWATSSQLVYRMGGVSRNIAFWDANSVVALANGGTGGGTAATARANLGVSKSGVVSGFDTKTAAYTFAAGDEGKFIQYNSATAGSFTIPPDASWAADIGTFVNLHQLGTGQLTIAAGAGVTIRSVNNHTKLVQQMSVATIVKVDANIWLLAGDITA